MRSERARSSQCRSSISALDAASCSQKPAATSLYTIENYAFVDRFGRETGSGAQRFYEGVLGFRFPMLFSGVADVREWYDDAARCFRIVVDVRNNVLGRLFGYRGRFDVEWHPVRAGELPRHILPRRLERRE
jgi:hypothetical protein